jgi:hypothetical protein
MFKLVKIEGSGTNHGEPIKIRTASGVTYKHGCPYVLIDGFLGMVEEGTVPTHIVLENATGDEKDYILAYRINDNMIFETKLIGNPSIVTVGCKYALSMDADNIAVGITSSMANGVAILYEDNGAEETGDNVYVRFSPN